MNLRQYLLHRHSKATAAAYEKEIHRYLDYNPHAATATCKEVMAYITTLRARYQNANTIDRNLCSLKAYYKYLCYTGKRKDNPARSITLRDKASKAIQLQDLFSPEELESLLEKPTHQTILSRRNKVLISLLIYQALLPKELEALHIQDIDLEKGSIYIKATATTNARDLPLKPKQIMLLHEYLKEDRPKLLQDPQEEILLAGVQGEPGRAGDYTRHVKRRFKGMFTGRAVTITTIRQSVLRNLLKAGNDLRAVQAFAGHKCPSTTEKYKQSQVEALKAAIRKYHPIR